MDSSHASIDLVGVLWRLGATLFFVVLNGFFVAAEFALVKVRSSRIHDLAQQGVHRAGSVQHILSHLDVYLSACQLGITLASLILGALGEPAVSVLITALARSFGLDVESAVWLPYLSIGVAFTIITLLHMTIGEQAPKMWALQRAESTSLVTARALRIFTWLFQPFISIVNSVSNLLLRIAGLKEVDEHETSHSTEEIRSILTLSARAGHISDRVLEITENVFRMMELEVRHIMVPRIDTEFLDLSAGLEENLEKIRSSGHSRLPVGESGLDSIVGFVHAKDVLNAQLRGDPIDLAGLSREALFVPDTMSVSGFLGSLQESRQRCGVVIDEHGTAIGIAFREDALEEIVGPLRDELDEEHVSIEEKEDGSFVVLGNVPLPEVCSRLGIDLSEEEWEDEETIGGQVVARLGRLARHGDRVRVGSFQATVLELDRRRIRRLRLEAYNELDEDAETGGDAASAPMPESNPTISEVREESG